jgi:hypothetical protein
LRFGSRNSLFISLFLPLAFRFIVIYLGFRDRNDPSREFPQSLTRVISADVEINAIYRARLRWSDSFKCARFEMKTGRAEQSWLERPASAECAKIVRRYKTNYHPVTPDAFN